MASLSVWAAGNSPMLVCGDARVQNAKLDENGQRIPPLPWQDQTTMKPVIWGQVGWDVGINFTNFGTLNSLLRSTMLPDWALDGRGKRMNESARENTRKWPYLWDDGEQGYTIFGLIDRLAVNCHGNFGIFQINGDKGPDLTPQTAVTLEMATQIRELCRATKDHATIYLMGCMAGGSDAGSSLLRTLSRMMKPRTIVGFSTVGHSGPQSRSGGYGGKACDEPGMRDTDGYGSSSQEEHDAQESASWNDLKKWPWADENSRHAKVAQGGSIIRWPEGTLDDGNNPPPDFGEL